VLGVRDDAIIYGKVDLAGDQGVDGELADEVLEAVLLPPARPKQVHRFAGLDSLVARHDGDLAVLLRIAHHEDAQRFIEPGKLERQLRDLVAINVTGLFGLDDPEAV